MKASRGFVLAFVIAMAPAAASGCRQALSAVFDVPPPSNGPSQVEAQAVPERPLWYFAEDTVRPPIESTLDPDSARALLPRDHAGNIDWVEALRSEIIKPRTRLPGRPSVPVSDFEFGFDFAFPGPDTTFDAVFRHSVHTEWVDCQQCHLRIFRYRDTPISMGAIFQGQFCGECHGKVAFPVTTGCERCHEKLSQPPDRAKPDLIGDILMRRERDASGNASGVQVHQSALPSAVFPHWVHRVRFRCKVCHMDIFEPRAGSNTVTMTAINAGEACGKCHNGRTAFAATMANCERCHVPVQLSGSR